MRIDLNENIKDPFNIGKYKLILLKMDNDLYEKNETKINRGFERAYDKSTENTILMPYAYGYKKGDKFTIYSLCEDFFIETTMLVLNSLDIPYNIIDITDDFLDLKVDFEKVDDCDYEDFIEKVEEFKSLFITVDKVLDKISRSGMESLLSDEKDFLLKS